MKYNYSKKSWNLDAQSLSEKSGNKRYLRYVIIALVVIIIALLIWLFSSMGGDTPSHQHTKKAGHTATTANKTAPEKTKPHHDDYTTIPLTIPSSQDN